MARYTGPTTKKARSFGEAIYGYDKYFERRKYRPGQHGNSRRRKNNSSDYTEQLRQKQMAKYTYGVLERQFRKTFAEATRRHGVTGEILLQLLEARLDNTVFRMGIAPTRRAARQLVGHKHITVNGRVVNIPSYSMRAGDIVSVRSKSQGMNIVQEHVASSKNEARKYGWIEWNPDKMQGVFLAYPSRDAIPEKINEQLIVELYSK